VLRRPLRPSLRVEYEYNLAVIDNAITTTRDVARRTPMIRKLRISCSRLIQSKIDLMNQVADARLLER
jgi:hypothetical protein